ncbi:MAG TPA: D-2-hydroxyacid dehydrogenase [Chitinophagales bacterium]|nr:D-2-hydroxyacid dehydrogenase [Chitinophagales bacterium]
MNIVVIDGYTLNPGDLDLSPLQVLGELTVYDRSSKDQVVERLKDVDIAVVNKVVFDQDLIDTLPHLKYISLTATGYNNLDIEYLHQKNILASNVSNYGSHAVAQHTFALILELTNHVARHHQDCKEGKWNQSPDFCFWSQPMAELFNKKIGIIGLGNIGLQTAYIAKAFGMEVYYHSRTDKHIEGMNFVSNPHEIFKQCDIVSLHCTLNDATKHLINQESLKLFRSHSIIINTSRGDLIDEKALLNALDNHQIAGAGLDVLSAEPPKEINPLIHHPKCIVTPHNAWSAKDTRQRLLNMAADNIKSFLNGTPKNLI